MARRFLHIDGLRDLVTVQFGGDRPLTAPDKHLNDGITAILYVWTENENH